MGLSIIKLNELLRKQKFEIVRYFTFNDVCMFVETRSLLNGEKLMVYIQSDYEFKLAYDNNRVFKIEYHEIEDTVSSDLTEERYKPLSLDLELKTGNNVGLNKQLLEQYNIPLNVETTKNYNKILLVLNNQLKRLKLSLSDVKYKCLITNGHYIACLQRDNRIDDFFIPDFAYSYKNQLYLTIDLKSCIEKMNTLHDDIKQIHKGLFAVFNKNVKLNLQHLHKMIEEAPLQLQKLNQKHITIRKYKEMVRKFTRILPKVDDKIRKYEQDYQDLSVNNSGKNILQDMNISHRKNALNKLIQKEKNRRKDILSNVEKLQEIIDHIIISLDITLFESIVSYDTINW